MALVLAFGGMCTAGVLGPAAVWMGWRARREIVASAGAQGGKGRATAGVVVGVLVTLLFAGFVVALVAATVLGSPARPTPVG